MNLRPRLSFTVTILIAFAFVFLCIFSVTFYGFRRAGGQASIETADAGLAQAAQTIAARTMG